MQIEIVPIESIKPNPRNPNIHREEQITRLAKNISEIDFRVPCIISKRSGLLVAGHGRLEAAKKAGLKELPVIFQDFKDETEEYIFMTSDNGLSAWAELDFSMINEQIGELGPFDIDLLGIEDFTVEPADKYADKDADAVPEVHESFVKTGEIWQLGNHRLLCADSTDITQVERLMNGENADMVFTSPPYNCGINYKEYDDLKETQEYLAFIESIIFNCFAVMKDGRSIFWNCGSSPKSHAHAHALEKIGFTLKRQIIWRKTGAPIPLWQNTKKNPVARNYLPNYTHENIFFASKGELEKGQATHHSDELSNDVWDISQFSAGGNDHPAAFPVKLVELPILSMTNENENLFEPFGGSGSTLIACEKTNRKCFMSEIDPYYCSVIIKRWESFAGQKAVRLEPPSLNTPK